MGVPGMGDDNWNKQQNDGWTHHVIILQYLLVLVGASFILYHFLNLTLRAPSKIVPDNILNFLCGGGRVGGGGGGGIIFQTFQTYIFLCAEMRKYLPDVPSYLELWYFQFLQEYILWILIRSALSRRFWWVLRNKFSWRFDWRLTARSTLWRPCWACQLTYSHFSEPGLVLLGVKRYLCT